MYKFGRASKRRFDTLHSDLQKILGKAINFVDITIIDGYRNEERQQEAFNSNASTVQWPNSKHNTFPSVAVDVAPWNRELRGIDWKDIPAISVMIGRIMQIADQLLIEGEISHTLRWGGDWDGDGGTRDQTFMDYVHLELKKLPGD